MIIEAFQMTEERRWDSSDWPDWLDRAWQAGPGEGGVWIDPDAPIAEGHESAAELVCGTLEGVHRITWGEWIIKGIKGELYPCKPDVFEATYEIRTGTMNAITVEGIQDAIGTMGMLAGDAEAIHSAEDALWESVLEAIAAGAESPGKLAEAVLKTREIDSPRWCG